MKATGKILLFLAVLMVSCERPVINDSDYSDYSESSEKTKKFTFTLKGDFSGDWKPVTRGYLSADGKDLTDVWVLDYMDGALVQQLHQSDNTAEDFGQPVLNLAYGSHHVYFIASRGSAATLDTDAKTISFSKVLDTFWQDYQVTVVSSSNGNRAVTMDRVVTRFRATITDAIPDGCASITIAPASWHTGLNYQTGAPTTALTTYSTVITIPGSYVGQTNTLLNLYGFSGSEQWTTNITITAKNGNNDVLGTATIGDVPFKANRSSDYSGLLFTQSNSMGFTLNSNWISSYTGTW